MGNKLFTQAILIVTSITIVVTYIQPAFADIADIQDDITRYESTVSRAAELNAALQELLQTEQSLSSGELQALETYLPYEVDDVLVMRDIQNIFKLIDLPITTLTALASEGFQSQAPTVDPRNRELNRTDNVPTLIFKDFNLTFYGRYEHLKSIMEALEVNAYPLEVVELNFTSAPDPDEQAEDIGLEPGVMKFDVTLRAYAMPGS